MGTTVQTVSRPDAELQVHLHGLHGDTDAPAICFSHSILASSAMWVEQAALLAGRGWRVVCIDTRGHGGSRTSSSQASMATLVSDTVAVLDALGIAKVHYVGLSLGGMSGFGLGLAHAERLSSLCLCAARADAPPEVANPWNERIAIAEAAGSCAPLAQPTIDRWFGRPFLDAHPETEQRLQQITAATTVPGFVACARAIQGLAYLGHVHEISPPTTLVVGSKDGVLPAAMADIAQRIRGSVLETIDNAGHLPNVDQPAAFNAALLRHLERVA
jgi:3-oxoadipate enol-lactonase